MAFLTCVRCSRLLIPNFQFHMESQFLIFHMDSQLAQKVLIHTSAMANLEAHFDFRYPVSSFIPSFEILKIFYSILLRMQDSVKEKNNVKFLHFRVFQTSDIPCFLILYFDVLIFGHDINPYICNPKNRRLFFELISFHYDFSKT